MRLLAIVLVALFAVLPISNRPQVRAGEQLNSQKQETKLPANKQQANPGNSPVATQDSSAIQGVSQPKSDAEEQQYDPRSDGLYRLYLLATVVGVAVGLIGLIFLVIQTVTAKQAANAALKSATALINSERAWITIKPGTIDGMPLRPTLDRGVAVFRYVLTNSGKTPARLIESNTRFCCSNTLEFAPQPSYKDLVGYSLNKLTIVPNESLTLVDVLDPLEPLTLEEFSAIKDLKLHLVVYGFVKYMDIYGATHTSRFCHSYQFMRGDIEGFFPNLQAPETFTACD